jgi:hypothetical protein
LAKKFTPRQVTHPSERQHRRDLSTNLSYESIERIGNFKRNLSALVKAEAVDVAPSNVSDDESVLDDENFAAVWSSSNAYAAIIHRQRGLPIGTNDARWI